MNKNQFLATIELQLGALLEQCRAYQVVLPKENYQALAVVEQLKSQIETINSEVSDFKIQESTAVSSTTISARENEVLYLIAQGQPNKEIAYQLTISIKTVQFHIKNLFIKLEATSRTEVVTKAIKTGLLNL